MQIAQELGENEFSANKGWIQRFKTRNNLSCNKICGEAAGADVDVDLVNQCENSILSDICKQFKPCVILNIDECGLFNCVLPDKDYVPKTKKMHWRKEQQRKVNSDTYWEYGWVRKINTTGNWQV